MFRVIRCSSIRDFGIELLLIQKSSGTLQRKEIRRFWQFDRCDVRKLGSLDIHRKVCGHSWGNNRNHGFKSCLHKTSMAWNHTAATTVFTFNQLNRCSQHTLPLAGIAHFYQNTYAIFRRFLHGRPLRRQTEANIKCFQECRWKNHVAASEQSDCIVGFHYS